MLHHGARSEASLSGTRGGGEQAAASLQQRRVQVLGAAASPTTSQKLVFGRFKQRIKAPLPSEEETDCLNPGFIHRGKQHQALFKHLIMY